MSSALHPVAATDPAFLDALRAADLPTEDLGRAGQRVFALVDADGPCAWGAWEGEGPDRLLRSVVVAPSKRGRGLGRTLVRALERAGADDGARRFWLLTTTAADVFEALGYRRVARAEAPAEILAHPQFVGLCPASAACLLRDVAP